MDKFWELVEKSIISTGLIAVLLVGACVYLWCNQLPVPSELYTVLTIVIAFFFGAKMERAAINKRDVQYMHTVERLGMGLVGKSGTPRK